MTDKIIFTWVDPRGNMEDGAGSGVARDIYSSFWKDVSNGFFAGEQERVPYVRHDLYKGEWEAMGRIILKGYIDTGYFPTFICKAFLIYCLFSDVSDDELMASFLNFLSNVERTMVKDALKTKDSEILKSDEFLEFLEQFGCRTLVNVENLQRLLIEIAKQEIIQKAHMMASSWQVSLIELKKMPSFSSVDAITKFYDDLEPTTQKVINLFKEILPTSAPEREAFSYLKRYIRGLDIHLMKKLLQFLTGSDILVVDSIDIIFTKPESSFERRPVAHTCAPCLELPSTYNSYCELREEFSNILSINNWEINII